MIPYSIIAVVVGLWLSRKTNHENPPTAIVWGALWPATLALYVYLMYRQRPKK